MENRKVCQACGDVMTYNNSLVYCSNIKCVLYGIQYHTKSTDRQENRIFSLENTRDDLLGRLQKAYLEISDKMDQIEKMKCCANCENYVDCYYSENAFEQNVCNNWKIKEQK